MKVFWTALIICLSIGSASIAALAAPPQLIFHKGDVLVYDVTVREDGENLLDGAATLTVLEVKPDGTASIKLDIIGTGKMDINNKMTALPKSSSSVIMIVKPNGTISQFLNSAGQPVSIKERRKSLFDASGLVSERVDVMRTLFGLQLPSKEIAPGDKWTGTQQEESASSADFEHWQTKLTPITINYNCTGTRQYQGRNYLVITYSLPDMGPFGDLPTKIYFDPVLGQVAGTAVGEVTPKDADTVLLKSYTPAGDATATGPAQ
jgi:hypothetical protein